MKNSVVRMFVKELPWLHWISTGNPVLLKIFIRALTDIDARLVTGIASRYFDKKDMAIRYRLPLDVVESVPQASIF